MSTFLLTVREVADMLAVSDRTVQLAVDRGELAVVEIGRSRRISGEDVRLYVQEHTQRK